MRSLGVVLLFGITMVAPIVEAGAQAPSGKSKFEVASVKPTSIIPLRSMPNQPAQAYMTPITPIGGRLVAKNVTLRALIEFAYGKAGASRFAALHTVLGGAAFIDKDRYDVEAKSEKEPMTINEAKAMMQSLLEERFELALHAETRVLPVYDLVIGKNGLKMKQLPPDAATALRSERKGTSVRYIYSTDMSAIVDEVQGRADRLIVDKTGLTGMFERIYGDGLSAGSDAALTSSQTSGLSLFEEGTGLRLVAAKETVEVLVIDHARPPDAN